MSPHRFAASAVAFVALLASALVAATPAAPAHASPAVNYTNPIAAQRADPHIVKHTDGFYYFTAASFVQRAGLAGSGTVSFEAQNFPGRYLRHSNYLMYVQAVPDAVGRADATFVLE